MTIQEINIELTKANTMLAASQNEYEETLESLGPAVSDYERAYNSAMLQIVSQHKVAGTKEPSEAVKAAMCQVATEQLALAKRVLEFKREALKSRLATLSTQITALQSQARMVSDELSMERFKPRSIGTF